MEQLSEKSTSILNFFLETLYDLNIIQKEKYIFSFLINSDEIIFQFKDIHCEIEKKSENSSTYHRIISYDLGIEKFFTGQKGIFKNLEPLIKEVNDKRGLGQFLSCWKKNVEICLDKYSKEIHNEKIKNKLSTGYIDPSLSSYSTEIGYEHLLNKVRDEMLCVFRSMGYTLVEERELEDEYHNFEALNIGANHPAREDQDSFYVGKNKLLRTHTSSSQIRILEKMLKNGETPPLAIICPGVCYRRDSVDATHFPVFRQMEGLVVDKNLSFADLKGTLLEWAKSMFGLNTQIRLRPDYFPFTEPSAELSISNPNILENRWLELLGCGMVHPNVFKNVGLDPEIWKGFAFGTGIERIAMMRYGIKDIRVFFENDVRFLKQSL